MAEWAGGHVGLHFIPPGETWRNGYVESSNSRIRDECLNINSFWSLAQARLIISDWKHDYKRTAPTHRWATYPQLATLPHVPTDERLSLAVDQFTGSGHHTYVEHIVSAFDRDGVAIAYGRQVGDERTKFSESRVMLKWFPNQNIWDQGHPFSNNANAAVLRSVWKETPYDESLTGLEDLDFAKKALDRGHKIAYVADAPVVHVHEETWSTIRNRYRREAMAYARIVKGSNMSLPRAVGLALSNIASDYRDAIKADLLRSNALSIPQFRFAQFIGAWQGFREPDHVSARLLERFYYPAESQGDDLPPALGRKIVYSEDP